MWFGSNVGGLSHNPQKSHLKAPPLIYFFKINNLLYLGVLQLVGRIMGANAVGILSCVDSTTCQLL